MEALSLLNNRVLLATRILRVGLAFSFLYAAYASFVDPTSWAAFFPSWITDSVSTKTLLWVSGVGELVLGALLLSGWRVTIASLVAVVGLLGIVAGNMGQFVILFRDLSLAIVAVALAVLGTVENSLVTPVEEE